MKKATTSDAPKAKAPKPAPVEPTPDPSPVSAPEPPAVDAAPVVSEPASVTRTSIHYHVDQAVRSGRPHHVEGDQVVYDD